MVSLQGHILDEVAHGVVLLGTLHELADQLGSSVQPLCEALRELRAVGWVAVYLTPDGRLSVRLERRRHTAWEPVPRERRQPRPAAWEL